MQEPIATEKMILTKKEKLQSTWAYPIKNEESPKYAFLGQEPTNTHDCGSVLTLFTPKEQGYYELTGCLPIKSFWGNQYMLVIYNFDRNVILVEPLNNRQSGTTKTACYLKNDTLSKNGAMPNYIF